jgi:hypothetical protein
MNKKEKAAVVMMEQETKETLAIIRQLVELLDAPPNVKKEALDEIDKTEKEIRKITAIAR